MRKQNVAQARQTSGQPAAAGTSASGPKSLTRRDVEEALGISTASVRRLEGKSLHPTKGEDGVVRFDPDEVATVVAARTSSSAVKLRRSADGELAAEAFTRFSKGLGVREVVIALRQPPDVIQELHLQWREAGGLWISSGALSKIRKSIAARYAETCDFRIATSQELINAIHEVLSELDDTREAHWDGIDEIAKLKRERRALRLELERCRADLAAWKACAEAPPTSLDEDAADVEYLRKE